jgi:secondary thiamine-phosphate synthase enzyme
MSVMFGSSQKPGGCRPAAVSARFETTNLMIYREHLAIETRGRGTYELTRQLQQAVERSKIVRGLCHLFIHHTSASLIVCENADPSVRRDLEQFAANLAPDGDPSFEHDSEGPDDMPAHIRSILTLTSLTIPVEGRRCDLGTWQGVFLWEHRTSPHRRRISVSVFGDEAEPA